MHGLSRTIVGSFPGLWKPPILTRVAGVGAVVRRSSRVHCESGENANAESSVSKNASADLPPRSPPAAAPPQRLPAVIRGPDGEPLEVVPVEKTGEEAWAGVASVDTGETGMPSSLQTAALVAGDAIALLVFAAIGRNNHGEGLAVMDTISTAFPFMFGWFLTGSLVGGYGPGAKSGEVAPAAATAAKCWIIGTPIGLGLRGVLKGYPPPTAFAIVSMVATAVLMIGWRSAFAAITPTKKVLTPAEQLAQRKNKKGNPFEFLQLLFSLTKRW